MTAIANTALQSAIRQVSRKAKALAKVKKSPEYPPDKLATFPYVVTYLGAGEWVGGGNAKMKWVGDIICEFHVTDRTMPLDRAAKLTMPYAVSFPKACLSDVQLNNTVNTTNYVRCSGLTALGWDKDTVGLRFEVGIKITGDPT